MELICYLGRGGEFCIGKLNKEQTDFIFKNAENEDYDHEGFWEENEIMDNKSWDEFDEVARLNTTELKKCYVEGVSCLLLKSREDKEKGIEETFYEISSTDAFSRFEIDLENDDRFEYLKGKNKVIIGWNKTGARFDKGFHTLKTKDFSDENIKFFSEDDPCLIGTQSLEKGEMWSIDVPDNFDINKLIPIVVNFHIRDDRPIKLITNLIYEGKILEKNLGDTHIEKINHFVMECNYNPEEKDEKVGFDYALEFSKIN